MKINPLRRERPVLWWRMIPGNCRNTKHDFFCEESALFSCICGAESVFVFGNIEKWHFKTLERLKMLV